MPRLKTDPITGADLVEFLDHSSDFAFEVRVLRELIKHNFTCQHSGTYDDAATSKPRQFDIRATKMFGRRNLQLAVECKNIRANFPLLVSCMPRTRNEAFEDLIYTSSSSPQVVRVPHPHSRYTLQASVGKSCEQVGRAASSGDITASDSDFYQKWAQALSSADELIRAALSRQTRGTGVAIISLVFALVVVPNGALWQCDFDDEGTRLTDPVTTNHVSYFVGRTYSIESFEFAQGPTISHVDFFTVDGLINFIDSFALSEIEDHFLQQLIDESGGRRNA